MHMYVIMSVCVCVQEKQSGEKLSEAKVVKLYGQIPPIEKMDSSLSTLMNCE